MATKRRLCIPPLYLLVPFLIGWLKIQIRCDSKPEGSQDSNHRDSWISGPVTRALTINCVREDPVQISRCKKTIFTECYYRNRVLRVEMVKYRRFAHIYFVWCTFQATVRQLSFVVLLMVVP
ncbi:unnamed protein product [Haemonchus placei]|uniref:Secreted protein n=1 Tax=Haemonchus placei TaxID=6290 RepID=A0A158QMH3_HAEPC|nr:unnamed protein product [Haemonchus placei]